VVRAARPLTLEDLRARRDEIERIATSRGMHGIRVFGSVARGQARAGSDVDFLVEMAPETSALDVSELILDLEEALGCRVDVVALRAGVPATGSILRDTVSL
jgi:uncharacterized protein